MTRLSVTLSEVEGLFGGTEAVMLLPRKHQYTKKRLMQAVYKTSFVILCFSGLKPE